MLCEKPSDLSLQRAFRCQRVAGAHGKPTMIRFNRRFDPNFAALHAAAAKGQIGKTGPLSITAFDPRAAASARHQGFGRAVSRHMIHDFYMAMWGMGVPQKVTSVGTSIVDPAIGVAGEFETAGVTLPFADGRIAAIVTGRISGGKLMETGGKTGIRVNQKVGKVGLDLRRKGCAGGFGDVTVLPTSNARQRSKPR